MGVQASHHQMGFGLEALAEVQKHGQFVFHQGRAQGLRDLVEGDVGCGQQGVQPPAGVW